MTDPGPHDRTIERAAKNLGVVVTRREGERGRPAEWSLPEGFSPRVSRQTPMARNHDASDKGEHGAEGYYSPTLANGEKPLQAIDPEDFEATDLSSRPCTECGQSATDISGLCHRCIDRRQIARSAANGRRDEGAGW